MEDYQATPEAAANVDENQPVAKKAAAKRTATKKRPSTKSGARGKKPAAAKKKKPSHRPRGPKSKGRPTARPLRGMK